MPLTLNPVDPLLRDREAALILGCGTSTFYRWVRQGRVPRPVKLGTSSRWPQSEILAVIDRAKTQRTSLIPTREGV